MAFDQDCSRLDARFFPVVHLKHFDLETAAFGPAGVHAQQHVRPILAFGAARASMDFKVGIVAVGLAREHRFDLALADFRGHRLDCRFGIDNDRLVALGLAHLYQLDIVCQRLFELADAVDAIVERLPLAHQFLGLGRVVPERRVLGAIVQVVEALDGLIPVKDASSAG